MPRVHFATPSKRGFAKRYNGNLYRDNQDNIIEKSKLEYVQSLLRRAHLQIFFRFHSTISSSYCAICRSWFEFFIVSGFHAHAWNLASWIHAYQRVTTANVFFRNRLACFLLFSNAQIQVYIAITVRVNYGKIAFQVDFPNFSKFSNKVITDHYFLEQLSCTNDTITIRLNLNTQHRSL